MVMQVIERRNAPDKWTYILKSFAIMSWILFIFAIFISYYAAPDTDFGYLRYHNIEIRKFWLSPLTDYLYMVLWLSALSSFFALIIDKYRHRRKNDGSILNNVLLIIITILWTSYILVQMSEI